jgi:DNA-binding NarL/FixJ family response regulator
MASKADNPEPIRVLLVDNEEVFRVGLAKLLKEQPHIEVVHQCGSGKEAIEKSKETKPDVILMNSQISDYDVLQAVKELRKLSPEVKVAMLTRPEVGPNPLHVLKAGARACLSKSISTNDLVRSIELISSGRIIVSPLFAEKFLDEIASAEKAEDTKDAPAESRLSAREMEVVRLIVEGSTNKEIAQKLLIAENTVKVHVKNILNKLELRNRQQLVAYAVLQNWVTAAAAGLEEDLPASE